MYPKGRISSAPTLVRFPKGSGRKEVPLSSVQIPDLWHIAQATLDLDEKRKILECWHLAHDLLTALRERTE